MNLAVFGLKRREEGDPEYADYWLELCHGATLISWEVPLTEEEYQKIKPYLPKFCQKEVEK